MITDAFITKHNFVEYMRNAIDVSVASAYLSRYAINEMKAVLRDLPQQGGRHFRFLLSDDFNPNESMRKLLVNMLLELPNVQVKIYKGIDFFHPKLYIFERGNELFFSVGSFNFSAGGGGRNVEAGVKIGSIPALTRSAKDFFEQYWESPDAELQKYDSTISFTGEHKFNPGDPVIVKATNLEGMISSHPPVYRNKEWLYRVMISGTFIDKYESELARLDILNHQDEFDLIENNVNAEDANQFILNNLLEKLLDTSNLTLFSYQSTRTETHAYQFRPLIKIMNSPNHRILIADEVGLGKTIEAGIIFKEYSLRKSLDKVLIITPNSLKTKWREEMRVRFNEYFDIIAKDDVERFIIDYQKSAASSVIRGIINYDQLAQSGFLKKLEKLEYDNALPPLDFVIIDEVHHLKNSATIRHQVVSKLTKNAAALVMLSATPIQLGSSDLYNLFEILIPGVYSGLGPDGFAAQLTICERVNKATAYIREGNLDKMKEVIREIKSSNLFMQQIRNLSGAEEVLERCMILDNLNQLNAKQVVIRDLGRLNILNVVINRTLRKDIAIHFPDRNIQTQEYLYSESEQKMYDELLDYCKEAHRKYNSSNFAAIMLERRAASSLPATIKAVSTEKLQQLEAEYEDVNDIED